jgi:DNA adenine methylase
MISWIGGKSKISKWIIPFIPKDIENYIEPFSGAMWVYFKMNMTEYTNLKNVVYNDSNDYLVNLFLSCKDHENFYNYIKEFKSQNSELFYQYQKDLFKDKKEYKMPDFEVAMKFSYLVTQVWSGISPADGKFIDLRGKYRSKFDSFKSKLIDEKFTKKFDRINIFENEDFEEIIKKYDDEKSFFYIDAPYYDTEHYYSNHSFGRDDHQRLKDSLLNIKGRFAMSYYYFDELKEWFPLDKYRWESKEFHKAAMAHFGKKQSKGTELLIMNY